MVSGVRGDGLRSRVEEVVDLASQVAFQAPNGFQFRVAFAGFLLYVGLGFRVESNAADDGQMQGSVGLAVTAAIEAVALGHARRCG